MTPVIGKFFGLPLDVRHVTLSTGRAHAGGLRARADAPRSSPARCRRSLGIAIIGALNFGVSFVLALAVALRARDVEHARRRLLRGVLARFFRSPLEFFFPPR